MSNDIFRIYRPITATPFKRSGDYCEYPPCDALKPYIRCFWGTNGELPRDNFQPEHSIVIPDTCMDIIMDIDNESGKAHEFFCGINDRYFYSRPKPFDEKKTTFAIRFYCHSVILFAGCDMSEVLNSAAPAEQYFEDFGKAVRREISEAKTTAERISLAENYLLRRLNKNRENPDFMNALYYIISRNGNADISDISLYTALSKRQLERIFKRITGVSPKNLTDLIRYQLLWQDVISDGFDVQEAVLKFGYCDQSHLLKSFKKFHGETPSKALRNARKDVAFLQYNSTKMR